MIGFRCLWRLSDYSGEMIYSFLLVSSSTTNSFLIYCSLAFIFFIRLIITTRILIIITMKTVTPTTTIMPFWISSSWGLLLFSRFTYATVWSKFWLIYYSGELPSISLDSISAGSLSVSSSSGICWTWSISFISCVEELSAGSSVSLV